MLGEVLVKMRLLDKHLTEMKTIFVSFFFQPKKLQKIDSQPSNRVLSIRLSPHVIVAFSIFLRLEGYAELLVTYDRKRAKGLLRLAMGVVTAESDNHYCPLLYLLDFFSYYT